MVYQDGWVTYLRGVAQKEVERRDRLALEKLRGFTTKVNYEFKPEVLAMRKEGRRRLEAFEQCRERLLEQIYRHEGIRLSIDQVQVGDGYR